MLPTVIFFSYVDISVFPFRYRPTIPSPLSFPPFVKFNSGESGTAGVPPLAATPFVNLAVEEVPSKYTPTPRPETVPTSVPSIEVFASFI